MNPDTEKLKRYAIIGLVVVVFVLTAIGLFQKLNPNSTANQERLPITQQAYEEKTSAAEADAINDQAKQLASIEEVTLGNTQELSAKFPFLTQRRQKHIRLAVFEGLKATGQRIINFDITKSNCTEEPMSAEMLELYQVQTGIFHNCKLYIQSMPAVVIETTNSSVGDSDLTSVVSRDGATLYQTPGDW